MASIPDEKVPRTIVNLEDEELALVHRSSTQIVLNFEVPLPQGFHSVRSGLHVIAGKLKGQTVIGDFPGVISLEELRTIRRQSP